MPKQRLLLQHDSCKEGLRRCLTHAYGLISTMKSTRKDHKGNLPAPKPHPGSGNVQEEFWLEDCTKCTDRVGIKFPVCEGSHRQW